MSTKEFEQMDDQVIAMVNGEPKQEPANKVDTAEEAKAENFRKILWLGLKVFLCGMAAALFLAAMLDPDWVPVLGYSGIAFFLVTAAIQIDRAFWRKQHG